MVTDTCGFDSLASVYGALYIDDSVIRQKIDERTCKFADFIKLLFQEKEVNSEIEFTRYELLKEVYPKNAVMELKNPTLFKCKTAISGLFSNMCESNVDIMASRERKEICSSCTIEKVSESPLLHCDIQNFDFRNVQLSLLGERTRVCNICLKKSLQIEDLFHDIIAIDCEALTELEQKQIALENIENQIQLNGDEYNLFAAIQYDPTIHHYVAHIKRKSNEWETYDDLCRTKFDSIINEEIFVFMLFYQKKSKGMCLIKSIDESYLIIFFSLFTPAIEIKSKQKLQQKGKSKSNQTKSENESQSKNELDDIVSEKELEEAWKNKNRSANSQSVLEPIESSRKLRPRNTKN